VLMLSIASTILLDDADTSSAKPEISSTWFVTIPTALMISSSASTGAAR
jgi:hypothetical protein